jgi:phosphopantothenoylcysteine decarboxylase/phosphopantothenate--cysteine ligase
VATLVLGVCGSISAYRAADLARELMRNGFEVRVCLTDSAERFVSRDLFQVLTGHPCLQDTFEEPIPGRMAHLDWARQADLICIAPASANTIAKLAHGIADDMLTTIVSASRAPLILAPAMNPQMFASDANQTALKTLSSRATTIVQPLEGDVVSGEFGPGKLATQDSIVAACLELKELTQRLDGKHVLITSGPTQEPLDSVRFFTNRSSGKMGAALARAAQLMGAEVTVVAGRGSVQYPLGVNLVPVRTAEEMLKAAREHLSKADWVIGAAAVADYRPETVVEGKMRRDGNALELKLVPNPDIIATLAREKPSKTQVVAFAAEPNDQLEHANLKIKLKSVFAIAVNDISQPGLGFDQDNNALTLVSAFGSNKTSGIRSKLSCALWLMQELLDLDDLHRSNR